MQFTIERIEVNGLDQVRLKDNSNDTIVSILPSHGALLHEFIVVQNGVAHNVIENYSSYDELRDNLDKSYRSAKLSPFVCRIDKGCYDFDSKSYELGKKYSDGSAIHGLVFDRPFEIIEQFVNENNACVTLQYEYSSEDPGYPFSFACTVSFTLSPNNNLQLHTRIKNLDKQSIPVSDGWHPYFKLGGNISQWELSFPTSKRLAFNDRLVPTGDFEDDDRFLKTHSIGDAKIDNCYLIDFPSASEPACILRNPANGLGVSVYAISGYPYLQIFTAVNRESVAIENLSGAPDCFNNRMGLIILKPGEEQTFQTRYQIESEKR